MLPGSPNSLLACPNVRTFELRLRQRQANGDDCAASLCSCRCNAATMEGDDLRSNAQPEAETRRVGGGFGRTKGPLENPRQRVGGDADTVITNPKHRLVVFACERDLYGASLRRVLDGVVHEILEHSLKSVGIGIHDDRFIGTESITGCRSEPRSIIRTIGATSVRRSCVARSMPKPSDSSA